MMASQMDNTKIQQRYLEYKAAQAEKLKAEAAEKLAAERRRAEVEVRLAKIQAALKPRVVTVIKAHKCSGCGADIVKGAEVVVEGEMQRVHFSYSQGSSIPSFHSLYYCNVCRKTEGV